MTADLRGIRCWNECHENDLFTGSTFSMMLEDKSSVEKSASFTGCTSAQELHSSGGKDSPKINQEWPVPKPRKTLELGFLQ